MKKDRSTEYMYISARVRAIEAGMPGRELTERMIGASDLESAINAAVESGVLPAGIGAKDADLIDGLLLKRFKSALEAVESGEGGSITPLIRTVYDCANIKAALRCVPAGIDFSDLLFDIGSLPPEKYGEMAESGDFSPLPRNLREAAEKARADHAATGDPLRIDLNLDRACYSDMLEASRELGDSFAEDYVKARIDMTNVTMTVRVIGMGDSEMTHALLSDALIQGGYIKTEELLATRDNTELDASERKARVAELARATYPALSVDSGESISELERICDELLCRKASDTKYIPFGVPVILGYLLKLENEMKNIRIILAGKSAGLSAEKISERVRDGHV